MRRYDILACGGESHVMNEIELKGSELSLVFAHEDGRLHLVRMRRRDGAMLFADRACAIEGAGPAGNPLAVVIRTGKHAGIHETTAFRAEILERRPDRLLARLTHDRLPLFLTLAVSVEGNVSAWHGQVCWTGEEAVDLDVYLPLFSRLSLGGPERDRIIAPRVSGAVIGPTGRINLSSAACAYMGNMSSPSFLVDGGSRGLAFLDDNRADLAADPSACVRRSYIAGNDFTAVSRALLALSARIEGGEDGPFAGICHTRLLKSCGPDWEETRVRSEDPASMLPGDYADLGPVMVHAYDGGWRAGASWLRGQRSHLVFRGSPADWYRRTTFISEDSGGAMLARGETFYAYPRVAAAKKRLGSDLFHVTGFHDPVILGSQKNFLNRGDYFHAARNLGGFEVARAGVEAVHRRGGRILYYVEGLIVWKGSRIGLSQGKDWALMEADGSYTEHYKGFWHMCPACDGFSDWLAETCAAIVRAVGVDGFFIDSSCATYNHRCFNPGHRHPHPDVWNWGLRRLFAKVRSAVDRADPRTILFTEGAADMAREYVDGFLSHSHQWTGGAFQLPFLRYLHPEIRVYESWGGGEATRMPAAALHVWNFVHGQRIYAHQPGHEAMAALSLRAREYHDSYPEICDSPMAEAETTARGCLAETFLGAPVPVVTVGNPTAEEVQTVLTLPVPAGLLFDRVDGTRVKVIGGEAMMTLGPWEFRAFEARG